MIELIDGAKAGDTDALKRLRSHYIEQLHERSDDFAATEALRSVEATLAEVPYDDDIWAWQEREARREQKRSRRRARRWWRRGR